MASLTGKTRLRLHRDKKSLVLQVQVTWESLVHPGSLERCYAWRDARIEDLPSPTLDQFKPEE